ncbi:hypothetical protein [Actinoplanes subglobosus]|uniref:Lipoprotein n=1 Tax=Actinoplanes subglobosus TaxID=1547892 RepID=A0ABV8IVW0_9ACTN
MALMAGSAAACDSTAPSARDDSTPGTPPASGSASSAADGTAHPGASNSSGDTRNPAFAATIPKLRVTQVTAAWSERWKTEAVAVDELNWKLLVPSAAGRSALQMTVTGKPAAPEEVWTIMCFQPSRKAPADHAAITELAEGCLQPAFDEKTFTEVRSWLKKADLDERTQGRKLAGFTANLTLRTDSISLALIGGDKLID